jgi:hypothetical protein
MNDELTVLDYVKALLTPWRGAPPAIPPLEESLAVDKSPIVEVEQVEFVKETDPIEQALTFQPSEDAGIQSGIFPWRAVIGMGLAVLAQVSLEPGPERSWGIGLGLYLASAAVVTWANFKDEWKLPDLPGVVKKVDQFQVRWIFLAAGSILSLVAFLTLGGNQFTVVNVLLWFSSIVFMSVGFWDPSERTLRLNTSLFKNKNDPQSWSIKFSYWSILLLIVAAVVIFFRFYRYTFVPPEMVSDHAEKLLDIWDLLNGEWRIFFPRNTGREGFQMYLTALVIKVFGTGISFNSLKIGTILAGLITLPFIYLLGVELSNKRAALFATVLAGIAYWPNVISRIGLRFSLYPLFVAPVLYFLIRGIRRSSRNDFILAGLFLGFGLHGYTPFRIVPFVILAAVGLYLLHKQSKGNRGQTTFYLLILIVISLIVFLPLLRYWVDNPEMFGYRAFTRLGSIEAPISGSPWIIFLKNLWNAMTMFFWSNGEIWPVSVPYRPALDVVSAALFFTGLVLLAVRYLRKRNWLDIFLILSIPLLMLPSILSLAFPSENPTLNRTAGVIVPVFLIAGFALEGFITSIEAKISRPANKFAVVAVAGILLVWAGFQNFDLVFNQYQLNYQRSSWNTSEIGTVIRDFSDSIGPQKNAFVVAYPHWVDTRLVGINAGFPTRDFAIWPDDLQKTLNAPGSKLFIIKIDDLESLVILQELYPDGVVQRYTSLDSNKDFFQFYVFSE